MKKVILFTSLLLIGIVLSACGDGGKEKVTIGISGTDTAVWDYVAEKAAEEDIEIEIVSFNDYVQPNTALADGEIDLNSFQTVAYFDEFIEERNLDLVPIATTNLAPMGIYSDSLTDVNDIPDGGTIALPNDVSNQGRALMLLEDAGLITLVEDYNGLDSIENAIVDNPNDYQFEEVAPAQIPRALGDVDLGVINNGIAKDSNLHPINDSIYREDDTATDYVNIIAANSEDAENETYNRIAELYQEEDTAEFIEEEYDGALIPTVLELNDIGW